MLDASCPVVLKLQHQIKEGYEQLKDSDGQVLIFGKEGHAEVTGLLGQTQGEAIIVTTINDLEKVLFSIQKQYPNKKIQIEIDYINQLKQHLKPHFPIDAILLDNMDRGQTIQCVQYIKENWPLCFIESSGGINLQNIQDYTDTGIHAISIGALTHQAVSKNIKLEFGPDDTFDSLRLLKK